MKKFKFVGFEDEETFFGQGEFTVGNIYSALSVTTYADSELKPDALFLDDNALEMWEELHGFEEVTNNDTE